MDPVSPVKGRSYCIDDWSRMFRRSHYGKLTMLRYMLDDMYNLLRDYTLTDDDLVRFEKMYLFFVDYLDNEIKSYKD